MEDRFSLKQKETAFLKTEYDKNPSLFERKTIIEKGAYLSKIGIEFPHKDLFPSGYTKYWPFDFIVEEIDEDGIVHTVTRENLLTENNLPVPSPTLYATLVKCNVGTMHAITDMAHQLGCDIKQIQYAGIKDTNALTAQKISFRSIQPEELLKIHSKYFFLKNVYGGKGALQTGSLKSNRFTIMVRVIKKELLHEDVALQLKENIASVKTHGFYNFFYTQRFSTPRLENFLWAISILQGNYEKAVKDYLSKSNEFESGYFIALREDIKNHFDDWNYILEKISSMPISFHSEIRVVDYLRTHPADFAGALAQIPEQVQIWLYAVSSYFFNCALSDMAMKKIWSPDKLPLILSRNPADTLPYSRYLSKFGLLPLRFNHAQKILMVLLKERLLPTHNKVDISAIDLTPEGIVMRFTLDKGQYATTFLSHLFNLIIGLPPKELSNNLVDVGQIVKDVPLKDTIDFFKDVAQGKDENIFLKEGAE